MAPHPQCAALIAAQQKKGLSWAQVATALGQPEQRVLDVVNGSAKPTEAEFKAIANVLGITDNVPHTGVHSTA